MPESACLTRKSTKSHKRSSGRPKYLGGQLVEDRLEIRSQGSVDRHRLAGERMKKLETVGVQEHPRTRNRVRTGSVQAIPNDCMINRRHMNPYLVGSTGFKLDLDQRNI